MPVARLRNSDVLENCLNLLVNISFIPLKKICLFSLTILTKLALSHDIDVENHKPIKQLAYRVNSTKCVKMQQEVKYLIEYALAIPSNSAWSSPCFLMKLPVSVQIT